jgi:hypothetical protein
VLKFHLWLNALLKVRNILWCAFFQTNPKISRAEIEKNGQAAFCVPGTRRTLSVQQGLLHDEDSQPQGVDPPHVFSTAGEISVGTQLKGNLSQQFEELLGYFEM